MFSFIIREPCISVLIYVSALHWILYLSFHLLLGGCAWFPSRVQQFLCQMTQSWHHASALHFALPCSATVWDCLGLWTGVQGHRASHFYPRTVPVQCQCGYFPLSSSLSLVSQRTVVDTRIRPTTCQPPAGPTSAELPPSAASTVRSAWQGSPHALPGCAHVLRCTRPE